MYRGVPYPVLGRGVPHSVLMGEYDGMGAPHLDLGWGGGYPQPGPGTGYPPPSRPGMAVPPFKQDGVLPPSRPGTGYPGTRVSPSAGWGIPLCPDLGWDPPIQTWDGPLHKQDGVSSCPDLGWGPPVRSLCNKKVLLHECKRHTACHLASAHYAYVS